MGKRIQQVQLQSLGSETLYLGYVGENEHTQIVVNCAIIFTDYPDATASIVVRPPAGDLYHATITRNANRLIWEITSSDVIRAGNGQAQFTFENDGEVIRSIIARTRIDPSIEATGEAPEPLQNWMDQADAKAAEIAQDAARQAAVDVVEEAEAEIERVAGTIPADYTELSDDVDELKSAIPSQVIAQIEKIAIQSANLFDKTKAVQNYYIDTDGVTIKPNASVFYSDYIPVFSFAQYCASLSPLTGFSNVFAYDGKKNYLGRASYEDMTSYARYTFGDTLSETAYVRINGTKSTIDSFMFVMGSSFPDAHIAYSNELNPEYILTTAQKKQVSEEVKTVGGKSANLFDKSSATMGKYINPDGTTIGTTASAFYSDYFDISECGKTFVGSVSPATGMSNLFIYDANYNFLARILGTNQTTHYKYDISSVVGNVKYARINGTAANVNTTMFVEGEVFPSAYIKYGYFLNDAFPLTETMKAELQVQRSILTNKTWYACGDSFTHGDFTGATSEEIAEAYDTEMQMYKTYPWQISKRNGTNLFNVAVNGGTLKGFYENILQTLPTDIDYLTIAYGINDSSLVTLGTINDTAADDTFYGYLRSTIVYLYTNMPYVHFGFIIMPNGMNNNYRTAIMEICNKYGVPYFNLYTDPRAPMFMYKDGSNGGPDGVNYARYKLMQVSTSNGHPSLKAHEFISTSIEGWLKSI